MMRHDTDGLYINECLNSNTHMRS